MLSRSNFPESIHFWEKPMVICTASNTTWGEEAPSVAGTFLGKCASITAVDLIQRKKLRSHAFIKWLVYALVHRLYDTLEGKSRDHQTHSPRTPPCSLKMIVAVSFGSICYCCQCHCKPFLSAHIWTVLSPFSVWVCFGGISKRHMVWSILVRGQCSWLFAELSQTFGSDEAGLHSHMKFSVRTVCTTVQFHTVSLLPPSTTCFKSAAL